MKRFRILLKSHVALCVVAIGTVLLSVVINVLFREYLGGILDNILQKQIHWPSVAAVLAIGFLLSVVLSFGKSWSIARLLHNLKTRLYQDACFFLLYEYGGDFSLGELSSLLSNDITAVTNSVSRIFTKFLSDIFCFVFSVAVLCSIDPAIAVVVVLSSVIPSVIITALSKRQQEERQQYMKELAKVNDAASKGLFSLESVKANALEDQYNRQYGDSLSQLLYKRKCLAKTEALLTAPSVFCAFAVQIAIIVVSGWFTAAGKISVGSFFVVITLMDYIVNPVMGLENSLLAIRSLNVSLKRLEKFLGAKHSDALIENVPADDTIPSVDLENISFSYTQGHPVLEHVSLHLKPGKCHYVLGANGAGKSTLIKLISGVIQPSSGAVFLCGSRTSDMGKEALAGCLSVMPQEPVLFSGSLLENIRLYQPDISRNDVAEACKKAGIHKDILALPDQYDTILSENGGTLSGGQKQRLSLARTILRNRPVLIFDEPTAALDDVNASQVIALIQNLAKEKVVIVVTHDTRFDMSDSEVIQLGG